MKLASILAATVLASLATVSIAADKPMLADRHVAKGVPCDACHTTKTGGPLKKTDNGFGVCSTCHGDYNAMAKKTQPKDPEEQNPHGQHDGKLLCTECHKGHKAGVNYCGQCHFFTFKIP